MQSNRMRDDLTWREGMLLRNSFGLYLAALIEKLKDAQIKKLYIVWSFSNTCFRCPSCLLNRNGKVWFDAQFSQKMATLIEVVSKPENVDANPVSNTDREKTFIKLVKVQSDLIAKILEVTEGEEMRIVGASWIPLFQFVQLVLQL